MIEMSVSSLLIVFLIALIIGLVLGVTLARPTIR